MVFNYPQTVSVSDGDCEGHSSEENDDGDVFSNSQAPAFTRRDCEGVLGEEDAKARFVFGNYQTPASAFEIQFPKFVAMY